MFKKDVRVSMGQTVLAIGAHYYAGLAEQSIEDAEKNFYREVIADSSLALCALRLAEHEVMHS